MTPPLTELLVPAVVQLDLHAENEEAAIRSVSGLLANRPGVKDAARLAEQVLEREKLSSTALGYGVAFPHARTAEVTQIVIAAGRSRQGVMFQDAGQRVHFLFVIGTPPDRVAQYLALVGRLARLLKEDAIRAQMLAATTVEEFLNPLCSAG